MIEQEDENTHQTWLGTSMQDMYRGQGPWNFSVSPIVPSKFHHVLYEFPANLKEPPQPHYNAQPKHWEDDFVRMPYSPHSLFLVKKDGEEIIKPRWDVINEAYSKPINSVADLETAISSYNNKFVKLTALHYFFNECLEEEDTQRFFSHVLPKIIQLALRLPELVPGSIPLLKKNHSKCISMSQLQVASLLANAFLCTFVWRKDMAGSYPGSNFIKLFTADERVTRQDCVSEKLKCIIHYFRKVTSTEPVGVITFERKYVPKSYMPRWDVLDNNLGNTKVHIDSSGTIEEALGLLQVDFANKFVGGGVLGYGCVQEEIRFVICPELIISRLFTEVLGDGEAVIITGVERYSNYTGYANSFQWDGNANDETPFDDYGRRRTSVAVIDAVKFTRAKDQFHGSTILRELNKAYVGFSSKQKQNLQPIATGNWGCGAFKGDPHLKALIQLMACSAANRDLVYYSFGDAELRDKFYKMHLFLANNRVTICQLWRYLCRFCASNLSNEKLYSFLQQCHFDMKTQPSLKQFLGFNNQKRKPETSMPSTSNEDEVNVKKNTKAVKSDESPPAESSSKSTSPKKLPVAITVSQKSANKSPVSSDEIIQIIDLIDGSGSKSKSSEGDEVTLLEEIDKMNQVPAGKSLESPEEKYTKVSDDFESTEIAMEVDGVDEPSKPLSFIEDKKKKITDYFSKMTNHVNSYL